LNESSYISNNAGKNVFVPFIDGPTMHMLKTPSLADVKSFPSNRWGIPEPPSLEGRENGLHYLGTLLKPALDGKGLDLIVVPGVAFDRDMNRLGHGKGYYDHFIQRCHNFAKQLPPALG
jgi:5-formyltetrahydrofolate cyclo-ligase